MCISFGAFQLLLLRPTSKMFLFCTVYKHITRTAVFNSYSNTLVTNMGLARKD